MARLDGKVAIVTGAGGGIGREHALLLAKEGAQVVVNDIGLRTGADAASVVAEITAAGGTAVADTNSATWEGAADVVAHAVDEFGRLDIVVNNATAGATNDLWKFTEAQWDLTVNVNYKGYFAMIREAAPHLCRQGSGAIVNTSSGSGFGHPAMIAYASAKEGVVGVTRTVARELGRFGVRCNAIRPFATGVSTAEYAQKTGPWMRVMQLTMGPEPGVESPPNFDPTQFPPSKIAPLVVWLCTDAAAHVNGRTFEVGGDNISLLSEPSPTVTIHQSGGWDLDALDDAGRSVLTNGLRNPYTLDSFPELKVFDD
ncbi:MAG: SDR family NAD(P)-dependent oxidoreductase [Acidimicrobiales bacterium]|nr:SDR family NAD(P)-dependent oxidoreductase [Acidimicrobiales bacterium]